MRRAWRGDPGAELDPRRGVWVFDRTRRAEMAANVHRHGCGSVLDDGERRKVDLGWDHDTIQTVFAQHADCLDEVTEPRFVEWDLWDSNVMIRDGKIVCVIDHERAYYGDPLIEAGFVASELPAFGDSTAFMRGYGKVEFTANERQRRHLYCLHLVLIMIIETVYRGHADTKQYDWARERLKETMGLLGLSR